MSDARQAPEIPNLELNRETIQELTGSESEAARGGVQHQTGTCQCDLPPARQRLDLRGGVQHNTGTCQCDSL